MPRRTPFIAIVDDEESVRKSLCRLFTAVGWESVAYRSGQEFLTSLNERLPDCILLDLQMPGLTGFDVQAQLIRNGSSIPLIVLTGYDEAGNLGQRLTEGTIILRKPVHDDTLLCAVRQALLGDWSDFENKAE